MTINKMISTATTRKTHPGNAAQRLDLPAIELGLLEEALQPPIEQQQDDQYEDDDQRIEHVHLFHQVEIIVAAGGTVGSEADGDSSGTHLGYRRNSAGDHHVARRVVYAAHLPLRQNCAVGLIHKNAVRGDDVGTEHADLVQILHRRHSVLLQAVLPFLLHFRGMNQDGRVIFPRQRRRVLKRLLGAGVDRVWRDGGVDQRIALPLFQEFLSVGEHLGFALVVGRGKVNERFTQHAAHARGFGFLGHCVFEVVHVGESRHTPANLFRRRKARSPTDKFFVHVLLLGGEDVFVEPIIERYVVVKTPKQSHGNVSVAIDESGQDQLAFGVDRLGGGILGFQFVRGPTATIVSPFTTTAPSSSRARVPSMVTIVPPVTSRSTFSLVV